MLRAKFEKHVKLFCGFGFLSASSKPWCRKSKLTKNSKQGGVLSLDAYQSHSPFPIALLYQILMNARVLRVSTMECVLIKLAHFPVSALLVFQVERVRPVSACYSMIQVELFKSFTKTSLPWWSLSGFICTALLCLNYLFFFETSSLTPPPHPSMYVDLYCANRWGQNALKKNNFGFPVPITTVEPPLQSYRSPLFECDFKFGAAASAIKIEQV